MRKNLYKKRIDSWVTGKQYACSIGMFDCNYYVLPEKKEFSKNPYFRLGEFICKTKHFDQNNKTRYKIKFLVSLSLVQFKSIVEVAEWIEHIRPIVETTI